MKDTKIIEEIRKEFQKEDRKTWCNTCDKAIPMGKYCWENHYDKYHPEINYKNTGLWRSGKNGVVEQLPYEHMGRFGGWDIKTVEKILNRVKRRHTR